MFRSLFDRLRPAAPPLPAISPIARRVKEARLTYLSDGKLDAIERALGDVARRNVPGDFVECGVALGGSAIVIASWMPAGRAFHGYDVFGMIPPGHGRVPERRARPRHRGARAELRVPSSSVDA